MSIIFTSLQIIVSEQTQIKIYNGDIVTLKEALEKDIRMQIVTPVNNKRVESKFMMIKELIPVESNKIYRLQYASTIDSKNYNKEIILDENSKIPCFCIGNQFFNRIIRENDEGYQIKYLKPIFEELKVVDFELTEVFLQTPLECTEFLEQDNLVFYWEPTVKQFLDLSPEYQKYFQLGRTVRIQTVAYDKDMLKYILDILEKCKAMEADFLSYLIGMIILKGKVKQKGEIEIDTSELDMDCIRFLIQQLQLMQYQYQSLPKRLIILLDQDSYITNFLKFLKIFNPDDEDVTKQFYPWDISFVSLQNIPNLQKLQVLSAFVEMATVDLSTENYVFECCWQDTDIEKWQYRIIEYLAPQLGLTSFIIDDIYYLCGVNVFKLNFRNKVQTLQFRGVEAKYKFDIELNLVMNEQIIEDRSREEVKEKQERFVTASVGMFEPFILTEIKDQKYVMYNVVVDQLWQLPDNTILC